MILSQRKKLSLREETANDFRSSRNQSVSHSNEVYYPKSGKKKSSKGTYESFLVKLKNFEEEVEHFKPLDLVYYFKKVAEENGYKYVIVNIQKDMAVMKRVMSNYSAVEICGMIEFLYESDQDYLSKDRLSPNLLSSTWVNTIYADTKLWARNVYVPVSKRKKKKSAVSDREWSSDSKNTSNIGIKL